MTIAYYISHPQVRIDPAVPVPDWRLSAAGVARLLGLAEAPWVKSLRVVYASDENKAIDTAQELARIAGCKVYCDCELGENERTSTGFLPQREFETMADAFFASPSQSVRGWERAIDAQARIVGAVERVLSQHDPSQPIAFSGHGGVGTLLSCHLASKPISRRHDQPVGGGNVHAFELATRRPLFGWTPLEDVQRRLSDTSGP